MCESIICFGNEEAQYKERRKGGGKEGGWKGVREEIKTPYLCVPTKTESKYVQQNIQKPKKTEIQPSFQNILRMHIKIIQ